VWKALSKSARKPLSLKELQRKVGVKTFGTLLRPRGSYSMHTIMKIAQVMRQELGIQELADIEAQLANYINIRELQYSDLDYHEDWQKLETVKFHVVMMLLLDLGLDIKTLDAIPPSVFAATKYSKWKFIRHHIFKNNYKSMDLGRLVLVLNTLHSNLEARGNTGSNRY